MSEEVEVEDWRASMATNIRQTRSNLGITQQELGKRSGIYQSTISKVESTGYPLSMHNLYRIAHGLGVTIHHLLPAFSADAISDLK